MVCNYGRSRTKSENTKKRIIPTTRVKNISFLSFPKPKGNGPMKPTNEYFVVAPARCPDELCSARVFGPRKMLPKIMMRKPSKMKSVPILIIFSCVNI